MLRNSFVLAALAGLSASMLPDSSAKAADDDHPVVVLDTTAGPITLELDRTKAPITVDNFMKYVDKGFYDGLIFHRVMPDFMIQTGGMTESNNTIREKLEGSLGTIKNESRNGLTNTRGTVAMARKDDSNSASSQFFINLFDRNKRLDNSGGGYTVFGKVTDGMNTVDSIANMPTTTKADVRGGTHGDVPIKR